MSKLTELEIEFIFKKNNYNSCTLAILEIENIDCYADVSQIEEHKKELGEWLRKNILEVRESIR